MLLLWTGLSLVTVGIVFLFGLLTRTYFVPFDYFGVSPFLLIGVGLFFVVLGIYMRRRPGESFWNMKRENRPPGE